MVLKEGRGQAMYGFEGCDRNLVLFLIVVGSLGGLKQDRDKVFYVFLNATLTYV